MNGWSLPEVPSPEMRMTMLRMLVVVTRWFHVGGNMVVVAMTMMATMNGWSLPEVPSPEIRTIMMRMLVTWW